MSNMKMTSMTRLITNHGSLAVVGDSRKATSNGVRNAVYTSASPVTPSHALRNSDSRGSSVHALTCLRIFSCRSIASTCCRNSLLTFDLFALENLPLPEITWGTSDGLRGGDGVRSSPLMTVLMRRGLHSSAPPVEVASCSLAGRKVGVRSWGSQVSKA